MFSVIFESNLQIIACNEISEINFGHSTIFNEQNIKKNWRDDIFRFSLKLF